MSKDVKLLREAYDAACSFIAVHVADPDITPAMIHYYSEFKDTSARVRTIIAIKNGVKVVADHDAKDWVVKK